MTDQPATPASPGGGDPEVGRREAERLERAARRHELGRPEVREIEVGSRTYVVADVAPLDLDGFRTIAVGTVLFFVAFVALLPFAGRLSEDGNVWYLWTCVAGSGLGLIGLEYCRRRRNALRARPDLPRTESSPLGPAGV